MVRWPDKARRGSHLSSGPIKLCHPATITEPEIKAFEVGHYALLLGTLFIQVLLSGLARAGYPPCPRTGEISSESQLVPLFLTPICRTV